MELVSVNRRWVVEHFALFGGASALASSARQEPRPTNCTATFPRKYFHEVQEKYF